MKEKLKTRSFVLSGWPLSSPRQIPGLFQVFLTETLIFIKPPEL